MAQAQAVPAGQDPAAKRVTLGLWATFSTYFVAMFFMNSVNIVQPIQAVDLNRMALFSWIVALPALGSAVATLMFGKLSDCMADAPSC
jgi:MFS family permease